MTSQERVLTALARKQPDRVPIFDQPWGTTEARWHTEGLPAGESSQSYFGFEFAGLFADTSLRLESKTIEETDEYIIATNGDGTTMKNWKKTTTTPELVDFSITTRSLWDEYKSRLAWDDARVDWEGQRKAFEDYRAKGLFTFVFLGPGFTKMCNMVGPERFLIAMIDEPDWAREMFMRDAELNVAVIEEMLGRGLDFDAGWIFDDLGFKHRGFFSPAMYRELLMPAHKLICDAVKAHGKPMILHSCGYVMEFIPDFIATGYDCIQPLEVKAGNDMLGLKRDFGDRLAFMGGIDVRAMADADPAAIEREISGKIPAMKAGGGYIYHSDHSVPDNVSFEQYKRVMELVAQYGAY